MEEIKNISLAILAHIDAGKTTLSERMLFAAGEIYACGDIDDGLTTMDYMQEEREKGITIKTGVAAYQWKGKRFQFLDTPGHIDFSSEVDTALQVADAGILLVSGMRGIETQTKASWAKLKKNNIIPLVFINKLDQGAELFDDILMNFEEEFDVRPLQMNFPLYENHQLISVIDVLSGIVISHSETGKETEFTQITKAERQIHKKLFRELAEAASEFDDSLLGHLLNDAEIKPEELIPGLKKAFNSKKYAAVYAGSAKQNIGVRQLLTGMYLFAEPRVGGYRESADAIIISARYNEGLGEYYLIKSFCNKSTAEIPGDFFEIWAEQVHNANLLQYNGIYGWKPLSSNLITGDLICFGDSHPLGNLFDVKYPSLVQSRVEAHSSEDWTKISEAFRIFSKTDPSLIIRTSESDGTWNVSAVGEVQLDILKKRLAREFHLNPSFGEPWVEYIERLKENALGLKKSAEIGENGVWITLNLEITTESQIKWDNRSNFHHESISPIMDSVCQELENNGIIGRGKIENLKLVIIELVSKGQFLPSLFKKTVLDAIKFEIDPVNVVVLQPMMEMEVDCPPEFCGSVLRSLESLGAEIAKVDSNEKLSKIISSIPLNKTFGYSKIVRSISKGTASYALRYNQHEAISDKI
jgi:elongation factor G